MPIAASTTGTTRPSSKSSARAICRRTDADIALRLAASLAKHLPAFVVGRRRRRERVKEPGAQFVCGLPDLHKVAFDFAARDQCPVTSLGRRQLCRMATLTTTRISLPRLSVFPRRKVTIGGSRRQSQTDASGGKSQIIGAQSQDGKRLPRLQVRPLRTRADLDPK